MFENCRDIDKSAESCASVNDTNTFWETNSINIIVVLPLKQVVMKDMAEPIKSVRPYVETQVNGRERQDIKWLKVELAPNEFSSQEDYFGFFESEPEPETFFSWEKDYESKESTPMPETKGLTQPRGQIEIILSNKKYEHERKVYALMTLIGDIGGFQGAVFMFPAFLLSFYTPKMFEASLLSEMPIKKRKKHRRRTQNRSGEPPMEERLARGQGHL